MLSDSWKAYFLPELRWKKRNLPKRGKNQHREKLPNICLVQITNEWELIPLNSHSQLKHANLFVLKYCVMTEFFSNIWIYLSTLVLSFNVVTTDFQDTQSVEKNNVKTSNTIEVNDIKESIIPKTYSNYTPSVSWWTYPSNIKTVKRNGNDLLVHVNKEYKLPSTYAPNDLVKASNSGIRNGDNFYVRNILINDLRDLVNAAKADGIDLSIVSGYRSYATQVSTYNYWVQYNGGNVDAADRISARAGHSQHQLGTAIDFSSKEVSDNIGTRFSTTKASAWLQKNAHKYGFVLSFPSGYEHVTGFSYESWHYRYIGKTNALEMKNRGMILEEFLRNKN